MHHTIWQHSSSASNGPPYIVVLGHKATNQSNERVQPQCFCMITETYSLIQYKAYLITETYSLIQLYKAYYDRSSDAINALRTNKILADYSKRNGTHVFLNGL